MPDNIPQWPFIPAIDGPVPLPKRDPRSAMVKALMYKAPIPMPRPDPRDWAQRSIQAQPEEDSLGAIHPDALMQSRGGGATAMPPDGGIDGNTYTQPGIDSIIQNNLQFKQRPIGAPPPVQQQDVNNGLFGVPPQQLQQMAASKPVDQNLPKLPKSGFVPSLSPLYMNDTHPLSRPPGPNQPPIFWQPG